MDKNATPIDLLKHIKQEYIDHGIRPTGQAIINRMIEQKAELEPVFKSVWQDIPRAIGRYHLFNSTVRLASDYSPEKLKSVRSAREDLGIWLDQFGQQASQLASIWKKIQRASSRASISLPDWLDDAFDLASHSVEYQVLVHGFDATPEARHHIEKQSRFNSRVKPTLERFGDLDSRTLPSVGDILETLSKTGSDTFEWDSEESDADLAEVIQASQKSSARDFIRAHDLMLSQIKEDYWCEIPKQFSLGHADLARIATVCLGAEISSAVVRQARKANDLV